MEKQRSAAFAFLPHILVAYVFMYTLLPLAAAERLERSD